MTTKKIRLYKFYPADRAKENLQSRKLKISRIVELNDPFEFDNYLLSNLDERQLWGRIRERISSIVGLISFCDGWSNPLLWSHYADDHKGLCLGFDIDAELAEKIRYFRYKRRMGSIASFIEKRDEQAMRLALTIKFSSWEYEREQRIFSLLDDSKLTNGMYFEPFSESVKLASVIIGARSTISSAEIRDFIGPRVKILTARKAFHSFRICEQLDPSLKK